MSTRLKQEIERIKEQARNRSSLKEGTTQTVSVMPVLAALGWDSTNPDEVSQEHKARGRVDIALHIDKKSVVFIESKPGKQRRLTDENKKQILKYCKNRVRMGVLTNGFIWYLYANAESKTTKPNDYAIEINFVDDPTNVIEESLECFLNKTRVRYHYEEVLEDLSDKKIERVLSEKWEEMLQQQHERLARALWKEVKNELPQGQGSLNRVRKFIGQRSNAPEDKKPEAVSKGARRVPPATRRKDLLRLLQKEPRATNRRIAEVLGITTSGVYAALKSAEKAGHIRKLKQGQIRTFQVLVDLNNGVNSEADTERSQSRTQESSAFETCAAKTPSARRRNKTMSATTRDLLALLRREPSATQARVAQVLGMTKSGACAALKRAEKVGHIRKLKHGRRCTYEVLTSPDL